MKTAAVTMLFIVGTIIAAVMGAKGVSRPKALPVCLLMALAVAAAWRYVR